MNVFFFSHTFTMFFSNNKMKSSFFFFFFCWSLFQHQPKQTNKQTKEEKPKRVKQINKKKTQLLTMDILAPTTMKNAAKCGT